MFYTCVARFDVMENLKSFTCFFETKALFSFENFLVFRTVALLFLFWQTLSNHEVTRLKKSSRKLQVNCAISFYFCLYLVIYACALRFDVTENLKNFLIRPYSLWVQKAMLTLRLRSAKVNRTLLPIGSNATLELLGHGASLPPCRGPCWIQLARI